MNDDRWGAIWQVYEAACTLPRGQRETFVHSQIPDPEAAAKVIGMLEDLPESESEASRSGHFTQDSAGATPLDQIPEQLRRGDTIGRFTISGLLGRGGMGEVYAAQDPELHRAVALKVLRTGHIGTRGALERFIQEARAASALNHPGIVTVYEVLRAEPSLAIVMELIEGASLRELAGKPNAAAKVVSWGRQIAQALKVAHSRGIVHRDIKPENVMLREDDFVKVLDFGLARHVSEGSIDEVSLGTLGYMSPEQVRGAALTGATDIFSLGVVLFELATGTHPFLAGSASETTRAIAMLDPGSMNISGDVRVKNKALDSLIRTMLAKDPKQRPSAATVALQLEQLGYQLERRGPLRKLAVALPLLAFFVLFAGWWVAGSRTPPKMNPARVTQFTHLDGSENDPSFSPDGTKIVFSWNGPDGANHDIYYQRIGDGDPVRLTSDPADDSNPVWSPDGKWIALLRRAAGDSQPMAVLVSADGGQQRQIARIFDPGVFRGALAWWPDGKSLIVRDDSNGSVGLVRLDIASGQKHPLTIPDGSTHDRLPMASPDGRVVAFVRQSFGSKKSQICLLPVGGGGERCIATTPEIISMVWIDNGNAIVYAQQGSLWRMALKGYRTGTPVKWTEGEFDSLAGDPQGQRLAAERRFNDANLWRATLDGKRNSKLISSSSYETDADISPDGEKIVFRSERTGSYELWVTAKDGSRPTRLTHFGGELGSARWSPDGMSIAFDGFRPKVDKNVTKTNIFVIPATGGEFRRLTDDRYLYFVPHWSRDGRWIYYIREDGSRWETWKSPAQGGEAVRVSSSGMFDIVESEDGKYLYYTMRGAKGIWRRPVDGGEEQMLRGTGQVQQYRYWQLGRRGIYFVEGPANPVVQLLNLATGRITRLPAALDGFHKGGRGLAVSPDGSFFVYTKEEVKQSDIFLIEGIK